MEYTYLNADQQKSILEARLRQLEQEHYGHTINLKNADPEDADTIKASEEALVIIDRAYGVTQTELAALQTAAPKKEQ